MTIWPFWYWQIIFSKSYYYWHKMIKHIQAHVDSCSLCRREKMKADKYQLQTTEIPKRAFAKVPIDLIVEMSTSHYCNKNILVILNHLTSWPMVKAIPDKEATTLTNVIFEKLILGHGSLEILLSDNGKEFSNDTLAYVCQEFGMSIILLPLTLQDQMARQRILIRSSRPQYENCVRQTKLLGIMFLTKFCFNISIAHIPLLVRVHTLLNTIEIHQYPYIN